MSINVSESYYAAITSQIAYVNDLVTADGTGKVGQELIQAILATTENTGITESQAKYFAENFRVVAQQPSTDSGFSATVFEHIETEQMYFAMRGTDNDGPDWLDAFGAETFGLAYRFKGAQPFSQSCRLTSQNYSFG